MKLVNVYVVSHQINPGPAPRGTWGAPIRVEHRGDCQCDLCRNIGDATRRVVQRIAIDRAVRHLHGCLNCERIVGTGTGQDCERNADHDFELCPSCARKEER